MELSEEMSFSKLGDINSINSPFEIIIGWQIDTLIAKKWDDFKVYPINGNTKEDVIKSNPKFRVESQCEPSFHTADSWVIFKPNDYDDDTKEAFRKVKLYEKDLHKLSQLQMTLHKADIETDVTELRQKIEDLFYKLFPEKNVDKPVKEPDEIKTPDINQQETELTLKRIFKFYTDYDKIIKLLKDNDYIESQSEIVVWKDKSKGCISKVHGLLEQLCKMGYITGDKLSPAQKISILKNTFIITAKRYSVDRYPQQKFIQEFSFIPAKK